MKPQFFGYGLASLRLNLFLSICINLGLAALVAIPPSF